MTTERNAIRQKLGERVWVIAALMNSGKELRFYETYISGIERGLRNPGIKNVARLAKALGLSTAELCKGVEA